MSQVQWNLSENEMDQFYNMGGVGRAKYDQSCKLKHQTKNKPVRIFLGIEAWSCQTNFGWNLKIRQILSYLAREKFYYQKYFKYLIFKSNFLVKNVDCTYFLMSQSSNFWSIWCAFWVFCFPNLDYTTYLSRKIRQIPDKFGVMPASF